METRMWTICWPSVPSDTGEIPEGWERWQTREEVKAHADILVNKLNICIDDILIFPPEADDLTILDEI